MASIFDRAYYALTVKDGDQEHQPEYYRGEDLQWEIATSTPVLHEQDEILGFLRNTQCYGKPPKGTIGIWRVSWHWVDISLFDEEITKQKRAEALAKLTDEDRKVLGL